MEITIPAKVEQEVDVTIHIEDVIEKINELNIQNRWNYISKLINGITTEDINNLLPDQRDLIKKFLNIQIDRF